MAVPTGDRHFVLPALASLPRQPSLKTIRAVQRLPNSPKL